MCRDKITSIFRNLISLDGYEKPQDSIFQLKRLIQQSPLKLWILLCLVWWVFYVLIVALFEAAQYDWVLAVSSLVFATLYVYTYKFMEKRYIRLPDALVADKRLLLMCVYLNRWLFFNVFLVLESIAFLHWGLVQPESGAAILVPIWLSLLAALCIQLGNLQEAFSFRIEWPKNQSLRDVFYTFYMFGVLFVLIILTWSAFSLGDWLYSHERLQEALGALASGAIVASAFAGLGNIYFVNVRNRLLKTDT